MEYYGNTLCVTYNDLVGSGIMSRENYYKMQHRGKIDVVRRGGGAAGNEALVSIESLPTKYREQVEARYPGGREVLLKGWICSNYEVDQQASVFFHDRSQTGIDLPEAKVKEYTVNASVLNTCIRLYNRASAYKKLMGETYNWDMMARAIEILKDEFGHTLPASTLRFRKKVNEYQKQGYRCLISGKFGNQSARKVDLKTEKLIVALAVLPNKPFNTTTLDNYNAFVCGELDVYNPDTGELLNPDDYCTKDGEPKTLSESTITNVLNKPKNKLLIDKQLNTWSTFMHEQMPHMHRHSGMWSLSQITMDDVDLTRKLKDTKQRLKAYYAYDVVSQCVVGAAYSRTKDEQLVTECFRDMFRLCDKHGWGMPMGIEVENHLMSQYKEGFLQAGVAFPFVHFCAPLNSQEKYAENMNGAKKKSIIHKNHEGIGRFYGKGKWRMEAKKVSDETNDTYEDKEYFTIEQLIADDRRDNWEWNHQLHPNQKMYPGMTRWDVLTERINPDLLPLDKMTLARYVGEKVETSIRRNSTVRVAHEDWWLSDTKVLERLQPNDYKVTACYLPDEEGRPQDVFLYQGDKYIDQVERVETYNRVMAEQTEEDKEKYQKQQKKVAKFTQYVKENQVQKVGIQKRETIQTTEYEKEKEELTAAAPLYPDEISSYGDGGPDANTAEDMAVTEEDNKTEPRMQDSSGVIFRDSDDICTEAIQANASDIMHRALEDI